MKKNLAVLGIVTALVVAVGIAIMPKPHAALAQTMGPYNKNSTTAVGHIVPVFNATDSTIFDGELVNIDTTTASSNNQRIYVKRFIPSASTRQRVIGLANGNIAKSSQGGAGQVLIYGYHPRARIGASGLTAYMTLKSSLVTTGSLAQGDSLTGNIGILIRYVAGGAPFKAAVWFTGGNGRVSGL